jgi:hypothetical protein
VSIGWLVAAAGSVLVATGGALTVAATIVLNADTVLAAAVPTSSGGVVAVPPFDFDVGRLHELSSMITIMISDKPILVFFIFVLLIIASIIGG